MTKTISIIMATIIILTTGVNTEMTATAKPTQTITASVKTKISPHTNKKKKKKKPKHKHYLPKGNMGKWFKSKKELRRHVDKVMNKYNRQYEDGEITWDEYVKRCPYGYEAWSCSCSKWTGNFKYHKG